LEAPECCAEHMAIESPPVASRLVADPSGGMGRLANGLCLLVERDESPPARWLTAGFVADVARLRSRLAATRSAASLARYARRASGREAPAPRTFEDAADLLARDAVSVALALRRIELQHHVRLPAWPDIVRRGRVLPLRGEPALDAALWFG